MIICESQAEGFSLEIFETLLPEILNSRCVEGNYCKDFFMRNTMCARSPSDCGGNAAFMPPVSLVRFQQCLLPNSVAKVGGGSCRLGARPGRQRRRREVVTCVGRGKNRRQSSAQKIVSPEGGHGHHREYVYFATCARGLGDVLAAELRSPLVDADVLHVAASGVRFRSRGSGHTTAYRACLWLRTATRVLHHIHTAPLDVSDSDSHSRFHSRSRLHSQSNVSSSGYALTDAVYQATRRGANWPLLLDDGRRSFSVQIRASTLRDDEGGSLERALQTRVKDAVCDELRDAGCEKPAPPDNHAVADVPLFVAVAQGSVSLYRDMAGASLHKRGYRADAAQHRGALNEAVAAGMLYLAGFAPDGSFDSQRHTTSSTRSKNIRNNTDGDNAGNSGDGWDDENDVIIVDPMCGSGTLLVEAALLRLQVAVGLYRRSAFPFERWADFDAEAYAGVRRVAISAQRADDSLRARLYGGDVNASALSLARHNVARTRLDKLVQLHHSNIRHLNLNLNPTSGHNGARTLVICNPPWGRRLEEHDAWYELGQFLRNQAAGSTAVLLSGDAAITRSLRMKARNRFPVRTGNVDSRVLIYDVLPKKPQGGKSHLDQHVISL